MEIVPTLPDNEDAAFTKALISGLSHDGRGIAHINGKITFVFGALPEEQVLISYTSKRSKFDEAVARKILIPSAKRVTPQCQFFGICGGCNLQHLSQQAQIEHKQSVLLEQLLHFGHVTPKNILSPLTANPYGYRRKARYSVRHVVKKQRVLIGFRELHNPRFLADINTCHVLHPSLAALISPLQDCLSTLECSKHIAQIEAAVGDNATALIFRHLQPFSEADHKKIIDFAREYKIWLYLQPGGYNTIHKVYPLDDHFYLRYDVTETISLYFSPADFTQINANINRQMIAEALRLLDLNKNDKVLDLFCGIGNFSLAIAEKCAQVIGIEGEKAMVERAIMNAQINRIENASFLACDLNQTEKIAAILPRDANKLLIDPPRSGAREVVSTLPLDNIDIIVYISCNPATLARDAGILNDRGFDLELALVMDMFTHTEHVEAMAMFKKRAIS
jgi:23S rRNA (uracil1939-C5)-methyltransferase